MVPFPGSQNWGKPHALGANLHILRINLVITKHTYSSQKVSASFATLLIKILSTLYIEYMLIGIITKGLLEERKSSKSTLLCLLCQWAEICGTLTLTS